MTIDDSRPDPLPATLYQNQSQQADCSPRPGGARLRLAEMRRDFPAQTFAAILAAFRDDFARIAAGLTSTEGEALARHGHVLTALAGELGETALSACGRQIELERDPDFASQTAAQIAPILAILTEEAAQ